MDEFKNMNGNSAEDNKVKIDFSNIESTESGFASDDRFGITEETAEAPVETVPQYVEQFPVTQMPVQPQIPAEPEKDNIKAAETEAGWAAFIGDNTGVVLGAKDNAVGLPTATWSLTGWSVADYEALFADIVAGTVVINGADVPEPASTANVTVNIVK